MSFKRATVGLVLLDSENRYMVNGELPERPDFDKTFLLSLVKDRVCLASENTIKDLPKSVTNSCLEITENGYLNWTVNLGIQTFKEFPPDVFFISRAPSDIEVPTTDKDKYFDIYWLNNLYDIVIAYHNLEIWIRK